MWTRIGDDIYIPRIVSGPQWKLRRVLPLLPVQGGYRVITVPVDDDECDAPAVRGDCSRLAGILDGTVDRLCSHCLKVLHCRPGNADTMGFESAAASPSAWTDDALVLLMESREVPSILVLPRKHWRDGCLKPEVRLEFGQRAMLAVLDGVLACNLGALFEQRDFSRYLLACDGVLDDEVARGMARRRLHALRKALAEPPPARYRELVETLRL